MSLYALGILQYHTPRLPFFYHVLFPSSNLICSVVSSVRWVTQKTSYCLCKQKEAAHREFWSNWSFVMLNIPRTGIHFHVQKSLELNELGRLQFLRKVWAHLLNLRKTSPSLFGVFWLASWCIIVMRVRNILTSVHLSCGLHWPDNATPLQSCFDFQHTGATLSA